MIGTGNIKEQQLRNGYFEIGSGPEKMLIMGSCRVAPYVNYFHLWNEQNGNRFTIYSLDPFNWNFHPETNEFVDCSAVITKLESDERILTMLKSIDIFIHEWYQNFGMFNIFKEGRNNIYQYGMNPKIDIMLPNWNDIFILFSDFYRMDATFKYQVNEEYREFGKMTPITQTGISEMAKENLNKFCDICLKSDLPEMRDHIIANIKKTRFFWNFNHITKAFSLEVFNLMNNKFLKLEWDNNFWNEIASFDMFENPHTSLTEYDIANFGFEWGEEVVNFKEYNKIGQ